MSIYDCFFDSIAGMHRAQGYLEQAANYIADPGNWGQDSPPVSPAPATSFPAVLANAMRGQGDDGTGGTGNPGPTPPPVPSAGDGLKGLGVGESQGPNSLLDAMILAMIAQRMYEANARLFAIENKIVGIIIHLGELNPPPDG